MRASWGAEFGVNHVGAGREQARDLLPLEAPVHSWWQQVSIPCVLVGSTNALNMGHVLPNGSWLA